MEKRKSNSSLLQSPSSLYKKQIEKDRLYRMYLLSEPAFSRMKENIDAEKHLTNFEKELKSILFAKKLPPYKKWLQFHNQLTNFNIFKRMMKESKNAQDPESLSKFTKLEHRINELEQAVPKAKEESNESIPIVESTRVESPSFYEEVYENISSDNGDISSNTSETMHDLSNMSAEKSSEPIIAVDDAGDEIEYQPPTFVFQNEEEKMQKMLDDELISKTTVYDKLEALPQNIRYQIYPSGTVPQHTMTVNAIGDREKYDSKYELKQVTIDPRFVVLSNQDTNMLKWKTNKDGWIHLLLLADDYKRVRDYLIQTHQKIEEVVKDFRERRPVNVLHAKNYTISDLDANTKILKRKDMIYKVSNRIIDDVLDVIDRNKNLSPNKLKGLIEKMEKTQNLKQNQTLSNPLNATAFGIPSDFSTPTKTAAKGNTTSKIGRKLFETSVHDPNQTLRQKSLHETYRTVKNVHKQSGKGVKRRWQKI